MSEIHSSKLFKELMILERDNQGISLKKALSLISKVKKPNRTSDAALLLALQAAFNAGFLVPSPDEQIPSSTINQLLSFHPINSLIKNRVEYVCGRLVVRTPHRGKQLCADCRKPAQFRITELTIPLTHWFYCGVCEVG